MKKLTTLAGIGAMLAVLAGPVRAEVVENIFIPLDGVTVTQECDGVEGEDILLSGTLHILVVVNEKGDMVSVREHIQPQDVSGVGQSTGTKYQGKGVTQTFASGPLDGDPIVVMNVNNFLLIGQGRGTKYLVHWNERFTYDAISGDLTSTHSNFRAECK